MNEPHITIRQANVLTDIIEACRHTRRVFITLHEEIPTDPANLIEDVVARAIVGDDQAAGFIERDANVFDAYLWTSGIVERCIPIRDIYAIHTYTD